jgi:hypothetical protein
VAKKTFRLSTSASKVGSKIVELQYAGRTSTREWACFPGLTELTLQSIASSLNDATVELKLTTEHSVLLQICMGEVYSSVISQNESGNGGVLR